MYLLLINLWINCKFKKSKTKTKYYCVTDTWFMKTIKAKTGVFTTEQIREVRRMARRGGIYEEYPIKQVEEEEQAPAETAADEMQVFGAARTDVTELNSTGEYYFY